MLNMPKSAPMQPQKIVFTPSKRKAKKLILLTLNLGIVNSEVTFALRHSQSFVGGELSETGQAILFG